MYRIFVVLFLLNLAICEDTSQDDVQLKPEDLDQLLRDENYKEFANKTGVRRDLYVTPNGGFLEAFKKSVCLTDFAYSFSNKEGMRRYDKPLWPKSEDEITIPVAYSSDMKSEQKSAVMDGLTKEWKKYLPNVIFKQYDGEKDYVYAFSGTRCFADIARVGGPQLFSVNELCLDVHSVMHLAMHVVGIPHESKMEDHEKYYKLNYDEIGSYLRLWNPYSKGAFDKLTPYDYFSLTHFSLDGYCYNCTRAINITNECIEEDYIGKLPHPSYEDTLKIDILYSKYM